MDNHEYQYSDSLNGRCRVCGKPRANSIHQTLFALKDMKEWRAEVAALTAEVERLKKQIESPKPVRPLCNCPDCLEFD